MTVIEALMILYAKEVATSDRVSSAIGRISGGALPKENMHHEAALLCWISHACAALKKRVDQEIEAGAVDSNVRCLMELQILDDSLLMMFRCYRVLVCSRLTYHPSETIETCVTAFV